MKIRHLGLATSLIESECYSEQMKFKGVNTGDNFTINDISSTKYEIIDSIDKLYRLQKELIKINNYSFSYDEWDFLGNWTNLSSNKKLEIYDKYTSHELNLFLYKKDQKFFSKVVAPFLACKMEKDLVDLYLLNEPLDEYTKLNEYLKLNALEKVLVIERMVNSNPDFSRESAKMMKDETDAQSVDHQLRNRRIEVLLNFNLMNDDVNRMVPPAPMASMNQQMLMEFGGNIESYAQPQSNMKGGGMAMMMRSADMARSTPMMRSAPKMSRMNESLFESECDEDLLSFDDISTRSARKEMPTYYQKLDSTKEFAETFYYGIKNPTENTSLVKNQSFLSELAISIVNHKSLILSEHIIEQTKNLTELVSALAFTDLQFTSVRHEYSSEGRSITYKANSNFLVFFKELSATPSEINSQILVTQRYLDPDDRYIQDVDGHREKTVSQFIKQKIYCCQVVITNTAGSQVDINLLTEVPQGSIPVSPPQYTLNSLLTLPNYHTQTFEYLFYFPNSGTFTHYPANVSYNGKVIAKADYKHVQVNDFIKVTQSETFQDLVLIGDKPRILQFLTEENLFSKSKNFKIDDFLWMLKDKDFWSEVIRVLKRRNYYFQQVWSFSIYHKEIEIFIELLSTNPGFIAQLGNFFNSSVINTSKGSQRHLEFDPLVNARAHKLGAQPRITNNRFTQVYRQFLEYLSEKPTVDVEDYLALLQYLILQDRYQEALDLYRKIPLKPSQSKPAASYLQIQYDYLSCYLDIEVAQTVAVLYENYPINTWKKLFGEVIKLTREINQQEELQLEIKEKEPSLMFVVEAGLIKINYEYVDRCIVRLYKIDLEVLFSKNPFLIQDTQDFGFVTPNIQLSVDLPETNEFSVKIPDEFSGQNVVIEIDYGTYTISKSHFATSLKINLIERYGTIKTMDEHLMPRSKAYVKAFAKRTNGNVEFYKDGYTDIRGKFDYVSLNTDTLGTIQRFALLVVDDDLGSLMIEANPPDRKSVV